ncbi:MAG: NUDIX hydrolase [Deltaproteobacteria bacterium]|nr:NUDIX hydrolase [Deltaproteobacteria bacterium]
MLDLVAAYALRFPAEDAVAARFAAFISAHPECFERACAPGHITGSAWLVSHDRTAYLLTHHRKLGRWLQVGGHADGDADAARVALREAREESGIAGLALAAIDGCVQPLDLDAHVIPARSGEPAHVHYDVRFLVVAPPGATFTISNESLALRWFRADAPLGVAHDESVARLAAKARALAV